MNQWMEIGWNFFSAIFQQWHNVLALVLLVCIFVLKQHYRAEAFNVLYVLNLLLPWVVVVDFLLLSISLSSAWYGKSTYELYAFYENPIYGWRLHYVFSFVMMIASFLFFIRAIRTNRLAIFFIILVRNTNWIFYRLAEIFGDYLPSSWSVEYDQWIESMICHLLVFMLLIGTYWWHFKRNQLPCPSIFKR